MADHGGHSIPGLVGCCSCFRYRVVAMVMAESRPSHYRVVAMVVTWCSPCARCLMISATEMALVTDRPVP